MVVCRFILGWKLLIGQKLKLLGRKIRFIKGLVTMGMHTSPYSGESLLENEAFRHKRESCRVRSS
jgi:hypothetical protein